MALITPVLGNKFLVKIGNGADPEVFAHSNLINTSRGVTFSTSSETDELIDLANQAAPAVTVRRIKATDFKIDGAGMINAADTLEWIDWWADGEVKNCQITDSHWIGVGPFVLSNFQVDAGDRLQSASCQITLEAAGKIVFTAVTP